MGDNWLAEQFEGQRPRLRSVAYRMLGSAAEADDAVQEAWIRLSRSDSGTVDNLGGWLTTVVARISLDMLRARARRAEEPGPAGDASGAIPSPEDEALLADSVGTALLVVLDTLTPAERVAFVLHDTFAVPFDEIGAVLDRSPEAAKQLAYRARAKVRAVGSAGTPEPDPIRERRLVDAFLAAAHSGDFEALVALLHPEIAMRADAAAVRMGAPETTTGASAVAAIFSGRAEAAVTALVGGRVGLVWSVGGRPRVAWDFTVVDDAVLAIEMVASAERLSELEIEVLE